MRALTLTQPWAGLVASGVKLIENRPWKPPTKMMGERFAIHASRAVDLDTIAELDVDHDIPERPVWRITSAIVGVATLDTYVTDVRQIAEYMAPEQERWFFGPVGFVLRDVVQLASPVPCKGALGFWTLPDDVARQVVEQLR